MENALLVLARLGFGFNETEWRGWPDKFCTKRQDMFTWLKPTFDDTHQVACLISHENHLPFILISHNPMDSIEKTFFKHFDFKMRFSPQLFFFLQCRTSTRHGRSTTGICIDCDQISLGAKPKTKNNTHTNKPNTTEKTNTHTKAKHQARQTNQGNCKLGETRWNKSAPLSPSNVLFRHVVIRHVVHV